MGRLFKWLAHGLLALLILAGIAAAGIYAAFRSTIPAAQGEMALAGLGADARILRDVNHVPHLEAENYRDAAFALGFAHAQDRLWQMHVLRMAAMGRLSSIFGEATLGSDIFLRSLDLAGISRRSFDALSPHGREVLAAYASGVNGWMERDPGPLAARLPPEFLILGAKPEPWEGWHSVALLKLMALTLDSNLDMEIARLALAANDLSPAEIDEVLPYGEGDNPPPLPDLREIFALGSSDLQSESMPDEAYAGLPFVTEKGASNNWVVSGERTVSGGVLLANDPHLGLTAPAIFYLAHLSFPDEEGEPRNVIGASLPGTPFILLGRTDRLAWGLTTTFLDSQDLYIERVKPDDQNAYATPDGWREFVRREETIEIAGGEPMELTFLHTRHGPVLPNSYRGLKDIVPVGHVAALQWVSLADDDTTADAIIAINHADNVTEFLDHAEEIIAPMQSIVVGDADGNIGLIAPGRVPLRGEENAVAGRAPVPGWLAQYDWQGYLDKSQLPRIVNPPEGALVTANANFLPPDYSGHITFDWDDSFRQERARALIIDRQQKHSAESMRQAQNDSYSPALDQFRRIALEQLEAGAGQDRAMLTAIRQWDGRMDADSPVPLILTAWWRHMQEAVFRDDLGPAYSFIAPGEIRPLLGAMTRPGARDWCDRRGTAQQESCGLLLGQSLSAAVAELQRMQGAGWRNWRWGAAHRARAEHRPFTSVRLLSPIFTISPPTGGGNYTLLRGRTDFTHAEPYRNVHAAVFRAWYDLSDLDSAGYIIATGQSGHFLSPHYRDMADDWSQSRYIAISSRPEHYGEGSAGQWLLRPLAEPEEKSSDP